MTTVVSEICYSRFIPWPEISRVQDYAANQLYIKITCTSWHIRQSSTERLLKDEIFQLIDSVNFTSWWSYRVCTDDENFIVGRNGKVYPVKIICGLHEDIEKIKDKLVMNKLANHEVDNA